MSSTSARARPPVFLGDCGRRLRAEETSIPLQYGPITRGVFGSPLGVTAGPSFGARASHDTLAARGRMFDKPIGAHNREHERDTEPETDRSGAQGVRHGGIFALPARSVLVRRADRKRLPEFAVHESDGAPDEKERRPKHKPPGYQAA